MSLLHGFGVCAGIATVILFSGCRTPQRIASSPRTPKFESVDRSIDESQSDTTDESEPTLQTVAHEVGESPVEVIDATPITADDPFATTAQLQLELFVALVKARNPSLQAANAAWSAAAERYPQAIALDDPMLQTMFAPATFSSGSSTQSSYVLGMAQRVPWHGKRALRGQIAQWDANATGWDAAEVQLRLDAVARIAFFDYYLTQRELDLNLKNVEVTQDSRSTAKSKYEANQVSEQDLSLADLELAKLEQEWLELKRAEQIAIARINTLIHRRPDSPIPPAPLDLGILDDQQDIDSLRETALHQRPELAALSAKIQSEQAAIALACKEYYPDFEFMGRYDSFWTDTVQRPMVGMNMNIPLNRDRRGAAVREAQCRLTKLIAEHSQQEDMVREEVQVAYAKIEASQKALKLYQERLLPAAEANLAAARAAYISGSIDFLGLTSARREFITHQMGFQRTLAEYYRSRAELERAVGAPLLASPKSLEPSLPISN